MYGAVGLTGAAASLSRYSESITCKDHSQARDFFDRISISRPAHPSPLAFHAAFKFTFTQNK